MADKPRVLSQGKLQKLVTEASNEHGIAFPRNATISPARVREKRPCGRFWIVCQSALYNATLKMPP
jgi:hypothetical protein